MCSSDAADSTHSIATFALAIPSRDAWLAVRGSVESLPRTKIIAETDDYLPAECTSAFFGFIDDLELHLRTTEKVIAVRSASRLGYSDLGVNRQRIEDLRTLLIKQGIVVDRLGLRNRVRAQGGKLEFTAPFPGALLFARARYYSQRNRPQAA